MANHTIDLAQPAAPSAQRIVAAVIAAAAARGIDQARLAARAGISPESLSRLKKTGGCRLSTLLDLARAAGFTTLDLAEGPSRRSAAALAARKLGAGRKRPIDAGTLVAALRRGAPAGDIAAHLRGVFEELPVELVHDLVLDEGLDYRRLAALAAELDAEGDVVDWLAEMAGDRLADPA